MNFGDFLAWLLIGAAGIAVLNRIATNPRVPLTWRLVAKDLEGEIYQDMITGQLWKLAV